MPVTTLTIRLDAKLDKALARIARTTGRTKSEIACEALKRHGGHARHPGPGVRRSEVPDDASPAEVARGIAGALESGAARELSLPQAIVLLVQHRDEVTTCSGS